MRITLEDSFMEIITKMADGNPGAAVVMSTMIMQGGKIDPQCAFPSLHIWSLDKMEIYGPDIWMLYKDVCHENMTLLIAVLRAKQFGIISKENIKGFIKKQWCWFKWPLCFRES